MLLLAPILMLLGAAALVLLGLRGRQIDDHPLCRRCRFDLVGLTAPKACPECGADLTAPHSTRRGHRQRRRAPLVIGLALLLLLGGGTTAILTARARGHDFNADMPEWMLELRANSSDPGASDGALQELAARLNTKGINPERLTRLKNQGLKLQANQAAPWVTGWGDLIEAARKQGKLSDDEWHTYARNAYHIASVFVVPSGQSRGIGIKLSRVRIGSTWTQLSGQFELVELSADGGTASFAAGGATTARVMVSGGSTVNIMLKNLDLTFTAAKMTLRSHWKIQAINADRSIAAEWTEDPRAVMIDAASPTPPKP